MEATDLPRVQKFLDDRAITNVSVENMDGKMVLEGLSPSAARKTLSAGVSALATSIHDKLSLWPHINAVLFLRDHVPITATVLSLRPADMYYSGRKMVSYLDPRLLPVYREKSVVVAWQMLRELGIDYIHIPDYYIPPIYNSVLMEICFRPDLAKMAFSADGTQIYELLRREVRLDEEAFDLTPGKIPWTKAKKMTGGRKALASLRSREAIIEMHGTAHTRTGLQFFQRDWSTEWLSGIGFWDQPLALTTQVPVRGASEYGLEVELEGHAFVRISLVIMNGAGDILQDRYFFSAGQIRFGELVMGPSYPERRFTRRFVTPPAACYIRIGVEHIGGSELHIRQVKIRPVVAYSR